MRKLSLACLLVLSVFFSTLTFAQTPTPSPSPTATPTRTPTPIPTPTGKPAWIVSGEKVTAEIVNRPLRQVFASYTSQHDFLTGAHKFSAAQPTPQPTATPFSVTFPTPLPTATPVTIPTALPTATPVSFPTALPTATPISLPTALPTSTPQPTPTPNSGITMPAGMIAPYAGSTAPAGWLIANGSTIGNASSGGTARANADTQTLFELLCNAWSNTYLPIQDSTGAASTRGASCAADYAANKRLPLPDLRGRVPVGAGQGSGLTERVSGVKGGEEVHTLTTAEMPSHGGHTIGVVNITGGSSPWYLASWINNVGGDGAHNTMPPYLVMSYIIKY